MKVFVVYDQTGDFGERTLEKIFAQKEDVENYIRSQHAKSRRNIEYKIKFDESNLWKRIDEVEVE